LRLALGGGRRGGLPQVPAGTDAGRPER